MASRFQIFALMAGILLSTGAPASTVLESASGTIRAIAPGASGITVKKGQRISTGSTVITSAKSQAILRFDDGQKIFLGASTEFTVLEYAFSVAEPKIDKFVFELHKGAIRAISSTFTSRTRAAYELRLPQAALAVLGTDFMVALSDATYLSVIKGTVSAINLAGAAAFGPGMAATVASRKQLATAVSSGTFPQSVRDAFKQLSLVAQNPAANGPAPVRADSSGWHETAGLAVPAGSTRLH